MEVGYKYDRRTIKYHRITTEIVGNRREMLECFEQHCFAVG
jgi:hypothetical protein